MNGWVYWLTYAAVLVAFVHGVRLYWRQLRWNDRATAIVDAARARGVEDFYWQRYGPREAVHALELHLRRRAAEIQARLDSAREQRRDVLLADDFAAFVDSTPVLQVVEDVRA